MVPVLVGTVITLVLGYLGISDPRFWPQTPPSTPTTTTTASSVSPESPLPSDSTVASTGDSSKEPATPAGVAEVLAENTDVTVRSIGNGGVEVSWAPVSSTELDHYTLTLRAISPVTLGWGLGFRDGDQSTTKQIFPFVEFSEQPWEQRQPPDDQVWVVCVAAMKETPMYVDITPYIIRDDICSDTFQIPA